MSMKHLSTEELKNSIKRCEDRLAWKNYGVMRSEARVRAALREYRNELDTRKQTELDFK